VSDDQDQDKSQKTEEPTLRRLEKAREEGQIPFSKEVGHWFMLGTLTLLILFVFPKSFRGIVDSLKPFLGSTESLAIEGSGLLDTLSHLFLEVAFYLALPTLFLVAAALTGALSQTKFLVSLKNMKPKLSKFSPLKGMERLFGASAWVEFLKNAVKFSIIAAIAIGILWPEFFKLAPLLSMKTSGMLAYLSNLVVRLLAIIFFLVTLVALLDYGYQKYQFLQNLKMSHQEIKDEHKETEGDPHIKQRLRQIRQQRSQRRMAQTVAESSVLVTNPTHFAIALKYEHGKMNAPQLVAKGQDKMALQMRKIATENKVPIVENPPLARALHAGVEEGQEIPVQYYEAVAKIMRYILKMDQQKRRH
tara:strand:+ start:1242 stop:2324 length:1083 start_codon:yes stop_codon:yes gene_type:complete